MNVFIVENHPDTLRSLQMYLEDLGHKVSTAMTVRDALGTLPSLRCEVLICDIGLPDGTGWELLAKLNLPYPIFAVAMSGFGQNADSARSESAGFRRHLLKPFRAAEIDEMLAEAAAEFQ